MLLATQWHSNTSHRCWPAFRLLARAMVAATHDAGRDVGEDVLAAAGTEATALLGDSGGGGALEQPKLRRHV